MAPPRRLLAGIVAFLGCSWAQARPRRRTEAEYKILQDDGVLGRLIGGNAEKVAFVAHPGHGIWFLLCLFWLFLKYREEVARTTKSSKDDTVVKWGQRIMKALTVFVLLPAFLLGFIPLAGRLVAAFVGPSWWTGLLVGWLWFGADWVFGLVRGQVWYVKYTLPLLGWLAIGAALGFAP